MLSYRGFATIAYIFCRSKMGNVADRKYLFRERTVRAILKEWREIRGQDWMSVRFITKKYDLPYFNTLSFLKRLAKDHIITWRRVPYRVKPPLDFKLTPDGVRKLKEELFYASPVEL